MSSTTSSGLNTLESAGKSLISVINQVPNTKALAKVLTVDQTARLLPHIETPVVKAVIASLREAAIPFTIAGSFAGYTMGMVEVYKDLDLFICARSPSRIPEFQAVLRQADITCELDYANQKNFPCEPMPNDWQEQFKAKHNVSEENFDKMLREWSDNYQEYSQPVHEASIRKRKRFRKNLTPEMYDAAHFDGGSKRSRIAPPPRNSKRLFITDVVKLKPMIGLHVDLVFAPIGFETRDSLLYAMYVIRHFDMQQSRVAVFNKEFDQPNDFHSVDLILPTWDDADQHRLAKYKGRSMNVTPSSLNNLSIHALSIQTQNDSKEKAEKTQQQPQH